MRFHLLLLLATISLTRIPIAAGDDAVDPTGKKYTGRLIEDQGAWRFRTDAGKAFSLNELTYVHFDAKPTPLPKTPLTRTLLLANEQRVTGVLLDVDTKKIVFAASWGKVLTLDRSQILGIENADRCIPILHDDFEGAIPSWQLEGKPALSRERAFFGQSSLQFDAAGQKATRSWKPPLRDGAIRVFFCDIADSPKRRWTFVVQTKPARKAPPTLIIDAAGYDGANLTEHFGSLKATPGWHLHAIEINGERLRIFVDDVCLGQTRTLPDESIDGIRCAMESAGKLYIDELSVSRRLPLMPRPKPGADQDSLWLEHGEQIFGKIVSADALNVVLDAKFGKRSFAWSTMRGILFAQANPSAAATEPDGLA